MKSSRSAGCPALVSPNAALFAATAPALAQAGFFENELGSDPAKVVEDVRFDMMLRGSHCNESASAIVTRALAERTAIHLENEMAGR